MQKKIIVSLLCLTLACLSAPVLFIGAETSTVSAPGLQDLQAQISALENQINSIMGSVKNVQTDLRNLGGQNNRQGNDVKPALKPSNPADTQRNAISPKGTRFTGKITVINVNTLTLQANGSLGTGAAAAKTATIDDTKAKVTENGQTKALADLAIGQTVMVVGDKDATSGTITATAINILPNTEKMPIQNPGNGKLTKPEGILTNDKIGNGIFGKLVPASGATEPVTITLIGLSGTVSAISADGKTLTVATTYTGTPSYSVDSSSAKITGKKQKNLADIKVNDAVTVVGQLTATNAVAANSISDTTQN